MSAEDTVLQSNLSWNTKVKFVILNSFSLIVLMLFQQPSRFVISVIYKLLFHSLVLV